MVMKRLAAVMGMMGIMLMNGMLVWGVPPRGALKGVWGEIEYACYTDARGRLTLARHVVGDGEWETRVSGFRAEERDLRFAIDGNGRLHVVFGREGGPLRYAFSMEQGGIDLSPAQPMTGVRERSVSHSQLVALDDGGLMFVYDPGSGGRTNLTVDWFSLYDGEWVSLQEELFDRGIGRGLSWDADVDGSGVIRLRWKRGGEEREAVSPDGGLTWELPGGEEPELPLR